MPDVSLAPRLPLDNIILPSGPRFALADAPPATRFVFRGEEAARSACAQALNVDLPRRLGAAQVGDERAAIWLGPDEWLLIVEGVDPEVMTAELEMALQKIPHSLVDVSHRQVGLDVHGAFAARALSAGCPLDLRARAFPIGMATRTIFDKAEIVLWRRAESAFRVEIWRSFAPYLVAALTEAAKGATEG